MTDPLEPDNRDNQPITLEEPDDKRVDEIFCHYTADDGDTVVYNEEKHTEWVKSSYTVDL